MLPLRIDPSASDFLVMRQENVLYVDKTAQIISFLGNGMAQLFTRPRRFGKSLLLLTIKAMYGGDRSPFKAQTPGEADLAVYRDPAWDWHDRPVLHLDMTAMGQEDGSIASGLIAQVAFVAGQLGMEDAYDRSSPFPAAHLGSLLGALYRSQVALGEPDYARIVVLVDEYDAPILDYMHTEQAAAIRRELADFYNVFKMQSGMIHRLVMTGITCFVREGLWSRLNHVTEVSQDPHFHDLAGFTDDDLDTLWAFHQWVPHQHRIPPGFLPLSREGWREWYNGYRFAEMADRPLYNPFAIMHSLKQGYLGDFWAMSGSLKAVESLWSRETAAWVPLPDWLPAHIQDWDRALDLERWKQLTPGEDAQAMLRQWDTAQLTTLLHQTGYLTLQPDGSLALPNREVAMQAALRLHPWLNHNMRRAQLHLQRMYRALKELNLPNVIQAYNHLLHQFPHQRFHQAGESTYNLFFDLSIIRFPPLWDHGMEPSGLLGDGDTVLVTSDVVLIVECKLGPAGTADEGLHQILKKGYPRAVPQACAMYLGLAIEIQDRQAVHWKCDGFTKDGDRMHRALDSTDSWPPTREALYERWATGPPIQA